LAPPLLFGLRMAASVTLALYVAFVVPLDNAFWAATSAAVVCQPSLGASLRKGHFRLLGTVIGAVTIVTIAGVFVQNRAGFLIALAVWGAACALVSTLLRNFASYGAALAGYTAAIVAGDALGTTGGPGAQIFMLAVSRASEICTGIVCAGVVLALTDFGGSRRRLSVLVATLTGKIGAQFVATLITLSAAQPVRRELIRDVIALDPAIDQASGESSQLRHDSAQLVRTIGGLFSALASWRAVATHIARLPLDSLSRTEVDTVLYALPTDGQLPWKRLATGSSLGAPRSAELKPLRLRHVCLRAIHALLSKPAGGASRQLLIDQTARALFGLSAAFTGLALLDGDPKRPRSRGLRLRFAVPDWTPPLLNACRALLTIGAAELLWILTSWSNGALCITWTAITVILFGPRGENAYAGSLGFLAGTVLAAALAAIVDFAVLPQLESFTGLCLVLACCLVPAGALSFIYPQSLFFMALAANLVPLVAPANQASYDTVHFYNSALALIVGSGLAVLSFQLLPPLSLKARALRLLRLTLRDLRRMAAGPVPPRSDSWEYRIHVRLALLPDAAEPLQRAHIVAILSAGTEIIRLARLMKRLGLADKLAPVLLAVARGHSVQACTELASLDRLLSSMPPSARKVRSALHARGSALLLSELFSEHAAYFDVALQL
jgi:uncharacterized membrane protein YccC